MCGKNLYLYLRSSLTGVSGKSGKKINLEVKLIERGKLFRNLEWKYICKQRKYFQYMYGRRVVTGHVCFYFYLSHFAFKSTCTLSSKAAHEQKQSQSGKTYKTELYEQSQYITATIKLAIGNSLIA